MYEVGSREGCPIMNWKYWELHEVFHINFVKIYIDPFMCHFFKEFFFNLFSLYTENLQFSVYASKQSAIASNDIYNSWAAIILFFSVQVTKS